MSAYVWWDETSPQVRRGNVLLSYIQDADNPEAAGSEVHCLVLKGAHAMIDNVHK